MSLPRILGSRSGFEVRFPYLLPEPGRVARWQTRLDPARRLRVGVAWAGDEASFQDRLLAFFNGAFGR